MKPRQIYFPIIIAASIVGGMMIGSFLNFPGKPEEGSKQQKIRQIIDYIDYNYMVDVNTDSLLDLTIRDMLHKLDPHSSYISESEVQSAEENIQGSFEGIGIEFRVRQDSLTVLRVVENGPAQKSGIKAGDRIVEIEGVPMVGDFSVTAPIIETLRGPSGSVVKVGIVRRGGTGIRTTEIERAPIPIRSIDVAYQLTDSVGIVKVNRFSETTNTELVEALRELVGQGMSSLILDLRDNPGGLFTSAKEMADAFLSKGKLIVYTVDKSGIKTESWSTEAGEYTSGRMVVLVNESSASASEVVAGALQDNDRALIIGRRTFGKGLVQQEMPLSDGSRMRLTTSKYYTPAGRSIQKPYEDGFDAYQMEDVVRMESGELFRPDSSKFNQDEKFYTEAGKVVYGGGGIMPDVFVPLDSSIYRYGMLYHVVSYARLSDFAFDFVDANRSDFEKMKFEDFLQQWQVNEEMYKELLAALELSKYEARIDDEMRNFIEQRLKAMIGESAWGKEGFYPVVFQSDPMVQTALKVLREDH